MMNTKNDTAGTFGVVTDDRTLWARSTSWEDICETARQLSIAWHGVTFDVTRDGVCLRRYKHGFVSAQGRTR
jgi:hypothetical protein